MEPCKAGSRTSISSKRTVDNQSDYSFGFFNSLRSPNSCTTQVSDATIPSVISGAPAYVFTDEMEQGFKLRCSPLLGSELATYSCTHTLPYFHSIVIFNQRKRSMTKLLDVGRTSSSHMLSYRVPSCGRRDATPCATTLRYHYSAGAPLRRAAVGWPHFTSKAAASAAVGSGGRARGCACRAPPVTLCGAAVRTTWVLQPGTR